MIADRYAVTSGDWDQSSTWSTTSGGAPVAFVPVFKDNVAIEGIFIISFLHIKVADLTISSGSSLALGSSKLTIDGSLVIHGTISGVADITFVGIDMLGIGSTILNGKGLDNRKVLLLQEDQILH